jgi:alanyl-tRNA synthetase
MTIKLYQNDSDTLQFEAIVKNCTQVGPNYHLILDQTYFYPEGGGQPSDIGTIGSCHVLDVQYMDGNIVHIVDGPAELNRLLPCQVDYDTRIDFMCQHTGQHLFSAVLDKEYKAATVGFHLTKDNLTIDINKLLTEQDYHLIEKKVNALIRANKSMILHYPIHEELSNFQLRKIPKVSTGIRLVEIEDYDTVPCGGTHVSKTGQVGSFKIKRTEKYKAGQRITFACGSRATDLSLLENKVVSKFVSRLARPIDELPKALDSLMDKLDYLNNCIAEYELKSLEVMQEAVINNVETIANIPFAHFWSETLSSNNFKRLVDHVLKEANPLIIAANYSEGSGQLIIQTGDFSSLVNAKELIKTLQNTFDLKGGGSPQRAQAGTKDLNELQDAYEAAKNYVETVLK